MTSRQELHHLLDEVPEDQLEKAKRALQRVRSGGFTTDGQPLSRAELAAIRKSLEQIQSGETISRSESRRRRGV